MTAYPREIPEGDALGNVHDLYEDIRSTMGIGMVNLIYRRMAAVDGLLDWFWAIFRPLLVSKEFDQNLLSVKIELSQSSFVTDLKKDWKFTNGNGANLTRVLDDYNRGNGLNLFLLTAYIECLKSGGPKSGVSCTRGIEDPNQSVALPEIIPMENMPETTARLIEELSRSIAPPQKPLIPSLFRHLAHWPDFLTMVAPHISTLVASGSLEILSNTVQCRAKELSRDLKEKFVFPNDLAAPSREIQSYWHNEIEAYTLKPIPEMLVIGHILRSPLS